MHQLRNDQNRLILQAYAEHGIGRAGLEVFQLSEQGQMVRSAHIDLSPRKIRDAIAILTVLANELEGDNDIR